MPRYEMPELSAEPELATVCACPDNAAIACLLGSVLVCVIAVYFVTLHPLVMRLIALPLSVGAWELTVKSWRLFGDELQATWDELETVSPGASDADTAA